MTGDPVTPVWTVLSGLALAAAMVICLPRVTLTPRPAWVWWSLVIAGVLGAGAGWVGRTLPEAVALAMMGGAAGVLIVVDLAEHRLPDSVVASALGVWAIGVLALAATWGDWASAGRAALASAALFGLFLLLGVLANGMLGFGDVKLTALLGAVLGWFSWSAVLTGVVVGILLHGVVALGVLIVTRNPKADVPMGPSLILGAAAGLVWGGSFFPGLG